MMAIVWPLLVTANKVKQPQKSRNNSSSSSSSSIHQNTFILCMLGRQGTRGIYFCIVNPKKRLDEKGWIMEIINKLHLRYHGMINIVVLVTDTILSIIIMRIIIFQWKNISCKHYPQFLCKIPATRMICITIIMGWTLGYTTLRIQDNRIEMTELLHFIVLLSNLQARLVGTSKNGTKYKAHINKEQQTMFSSI